MLYAEAVMLVTNGLLTSTAEICFDISGIYSETISVISLG
jgi:hypothetical protein